MCYIAFGVFIFFFLLCDWTEERVINNYFQLAIPLNTLDIKNHVFFFHGQAVFMLPYEWHPGVPDVAPGFIQAPAEGYLSDQMSFSCRQVWHACTLPASGVLKQLN